MKKIAQNFFLVSKEQEIYERLVALSHTPGGHASEEFDQLLSELPDDSPVFAALFGYWISLDGFRLERKIRD